MFFRAEARLRWRAWLALALIVGVFSGVVTATAAGARRTDAAYPSLLAWSKAPDVMLFSAARASRTFATLSPAALARLPQASMAAQLAGYTAVDPSEAELLAPRDDRVPGTFWHRKLLAGRLPDPRRPGEADIAFTVAQHHHLRVGDTLPIVLLAAGNKLVTVRLRVVGIDAAPAEFPPQSGTGVETVWTTPAFYRQHARQPLVAFTGVALRLRHGAADLAAVQREATQLGHGKVVQAYPLATQAVNTERSIHLQAVALWLVAGLLAVIGLLIAGQLLARLSFLESAGHAALRAVGMSRRQLLAAGITRAALIGAAGGTAAVAIAVALSPLFPLGLGGIAEPHPGIRADLLTLAAGLAATILATACCAAWPSWRTAAGQPASGTGPAGRRAGRRPVLTALTSGLSPVSGTVGVRLALTRGDGPTALPVRSTVAGAFLGVAALTAAVVFSASLDHLLATPRLYGVTWDAAVSSLDSDAPGGVLPAVRALARDPRVTAWSEGYIGAPLQIRGVAVDSIAMYPGHGGSQLPVLVAGRLPRRPGEIALGARTLAATHARLGASVRVSLGGAHPLPVRIVGVAVFPSLGDTIGLGKGATLTVGGLFRLVPGTFRPPAPDHLLVRFRAGTSPAAQTGMLGTQLARAGPYTVEGPATPADLVNFGRVQGLPLLLGGALSALALLTIAHLLITSVRRRRRDLAVLRTLGFTRGQVRGTVTWQACTLAACALIIGIPLGIICGRLAWQVFTSQLGILPVLRLPALTLAVMVPAALALAAVVAALPGESAARARPARILRGE
jgi:ABC-type lipoprotein release transport system permease subunit